MEPWEQNLQNIQNIQRAQLAGAMLRNQREQLQAQARQSAQADDQADATNALLEELVFEQKIAGLSKGEKEQARIEHARQKQARIAAEEAEEEARAAAWARNNAAEQSRYRASKRKKNIGLGIFIAFCLYYIYGTSLPHMEEQKQARESERERWDAQRTQRMAEDQQRMAEEAKAVEEKKITVVDEAKAKMDAAQERAAFFWLKKATNGEANAQLEVGLRYLSGKGVLVDTSLATHWLKAAAAQGDKKAKAELDRLGIP